MIKSEATLGNTMAQWAGAIMMLGWMLILGPVGALLLGGVAYSMLAKNSAVGVFCGVPILSPLFLTVAWGIGMVVHVRLKKRIARAAVLPATKVLDSPTT